MADTVRIHLKIHNAFLKDTYLFIKFLWAWQFQTIRGSLMNNELKHLTFYWLCAGFFIVLGISISGMVFYLKIIMSYWSMFNFNSFYSILITFLFSMILTLWLDK